MKPRNDISLILSNYNYGEYIYETLALVYNQSEVPDEVIVVEDASTDHSREVLERAEKTWPTLKVVYNERNLGCAVSLNNAYAMAQGKYVSSLGMDDPLHEPHFFARALEQTRRHPHAGFYFGECVYGVIAPTALLSTPIAVKLANEPRYFSATEFGDVYRSRDNLSIPTVPSLWPREALIGIGGMRDELGWLADWFAAHVLSFRSGACYLPGLYQIIRYNMRSLSQSGQSQSGPYRMLIARILDLLNEPHFADVRDYFKIPAVMGRHGFKLIDLCLREDRFASYLSPGLIRAASLYETGQFDIDLSRFGKQPPLDILREIARRVLAAQAVKLRRETTELRRQGRYARALGSCRRAADAAPADSSIGDELAELTALSAKWTRAEDRL